MIEGKKKDAAKGGGEGNSDAIDFAIVVGKTISGKPYLQYKGDMDVWKMSQLSNFLSEVVRLDWQIFLGDISNKKEEGAS